MISEQEAREAAARIVAYDTGTPLSRVYLHVTDPIEAANNDAWDLARQHIKELARREAERVERAKPIDAEWCLVNGACDCGSHMRFLVNELHLLWHKASEITRLNGTPLGARKTRGQLLDLLAALKGDPA